MTTENKEYIKSMTNWFKGQDLLLEGLKHQQVSLDKEIKLKQRQLKHCVDESVHEKRVMIKSIERFDKWNELNK